MSERRRERSPYDRNRPFHGHRDTKDRRRPPHSTFQGRSNFFKTEKLKEKVVISQLAGDIRQGKAQIIFLGL